MRFWRRNEFTENARSGKLDKVLVLLRNGADVSANDGNGCTSLILASSGGHLEVVHALLDHDGVDVNVKDNDDDTALRALLNHDGVDVNVQNGNGISAFMAACYLDNLELVCALLNHDGVDVNAKDDDGDTAHITARGKGYLEFVLC